MLGDKRKTQCPAVPAPFPSRSPSLFATLITLFLEPSRSARQTYIGMPTGCDGRDGRDRQLGRCRRLVALRLPQLERYRVGRMAITRFSRHCRPLDTPCRRSTVTTFIPSTGYAHLTPSSGTLRTLGRVHLSLTMHVTLLERCNNYGCSGACYRLGHGWRRIQPDGCRAAQLPPLIHRAIDLKFQAQRIDQCRQFPISGGGRPQVILERLRQILAPALPGRSLTVQILRRCSGATLNNETTLSSTAVISDTFRMRWSFKCQLTTIAHGHALNAANTFIFRRALHFRWRNTGARHGYIFEYSLRLTLGNSSTSTLRSWRWHP